MIYIRMDGSPVEVESSIAPFTYQNRWAGTVILRDISQRKKAENQLALLKTSVDQAYDEVFWLDFEGNILYANDSACETTGYTREDFRNMKIFALDPDFSPEIWSKSIMDLRNRKRQLLTTRHRRKDGSIIDVEIMASYVQKGGMEFSFAFVRDITERNKMQQIIHESTEQFQRLISRTFDAVVLHQNGRIVEANDAAARIYGVSSARELHGKAVMDLVHPESRQKVIDRVRRMLQSQEWAVPLSEERFLSVDGSAVDVEVMATATVYQGSPAVMVVFRDISDRRSAEKAAYLAHKKLALMNDITRHDALNIVTGILGCIEMAGSLEDKNERDSLLFQVKERVGAIERQISFTREFEEVGVHPSAWQDLGSLLDKVIQEFSASGIEIRQESDTFEVFADPLLERVFPILINSVIRYGGNTLTGIRFYHGGSLTGITLICESDGLGIPEGAKEAIFERRVGEEGSMRLFLIREILAITGISIRETGVFCSGSRFELAFPSGTFRFPGKN